MPLMRQNVRQKTHRDSPRQPARWYSLAGLTICLVFVTATPNADAQSGLRRLFTTPALRAELDRRRLQELQPGTEIIAPVIVEPLEEEISSDDTPAADTIYAVGGSMRRSDGSYTIWINDVATPAADLPANMELMQPYNQGQVRIRNPETGASYIVKPGQVLNLTLGELMESYEYRSRTAAAAARIRAAANAAASQADDEAAADSPGNSSPDTTQAAELLEQAQRIRVVPQ